MCGIFGYIGNKNALPIVLDGLARLEYRGYDSCGLACLNKGKLIFEKIKGRISFLEKKVKTKNFPFSSISIAHTRWATHGRVSRLNAHPHFDCHKEIALVHNGIIENYKELKEGLTKEGHKFVSETDTEIIAHLIEKYYKKSLVRALEKTLLDLRGTYGLAIISSREPDKIVAVRCGSPLVCGIKGKEYFIASDLAAILPYTRRYITPSQNEIVVLNKGKMKITSAGKKIKKKIETASWRPEDVGKKGFKHFMLKEIFEQPEVVRNAMRGRIISSKGSAWLGGLNLDKERIKKVKRILFIACGTAFYAGLCGKYIIEELARIPVDVEIASEFRYKELILDQDTLIFVISQSGETADTIAAMHIIQKQGFRVYGISNVVNSTIAKETNAGSFIHAGPEIGVASTKAFVGQITVLALLACSLARAKKVISLTRGKRIISELCRIPRKQKTILDKSNQIRKLAKKYSKHKNFFFLGRKFNYPIALEGALKLKEISYIHAEAYAAGEMKHGPIALVDRSFPSVVISPKDSVYEKTINNIEELKSRKGKVVAIATEGDNSIEGLVDDVVYIPKTEEVFEPFLTVIPCQLFAYYVACFKGRDVDKPRNLAKSVTVE